MGRLDGKVAVTTGDTSGIGLETVKAFVQEGAKAMFCGRGEHVGEQIAQELGENCAFTKCDVTDEAQIERVIEQTVNKWGKLDILFNNAGGPMGPLHLNQIEKGHIEGNFNFF